MRLSLPLSLLLLCFLCSPASAQQGKRYALLVGVTEYDSSTFTPLKYTENDATKTAAALKSYDEVILLTTSKGKKDKAEAPTAENIRKALDRLLRKVKRDDMLLVGLAGHGMLWTVVDEKTKKEREESFFCPQDARPRSGKSIEEMSKTMIPIGELFKSLDESGAGVRLMLIDACRNDVQGSDRSIDFDTLPRTKKGTAVLFSCKSGERAFEAEALKHGVFFHHVIKGLEGAAKDRKGRITWSKLVDHVVEKVTEDVPILIRDGAKQTPHEIRNIEGLSPLLLPLGVAVSEEEALFRKGMDFLLGKGVTMDVNKAEEALEAAAKKNHHVARATLVWVTNYRSWNQAKVRLKALPDETVPALKKAADAGDAEAMVALAKLYMNGLEGGDDKAAYELMSKAAEKGHWMGMNDKAWLEWSGRGTEKDIASAKKGFEKAAALGYSQSMANLGRMYLEGNDVVNKNPDEAAEWIRKAAEAGHPLGQVRLVRMYRAGEGVEKDAQKAFAWCKKAAEQGLADAQNLLGILYAAGEGTEKDAEEAANWYEKAANQGDLNGQFNLAHLYLDGNGVPRSDEKAFGWMKKAAAFERFPNAHWRLGWMYENGRGTTRGYDEAFEWYKKAANAGHVEAMYDLGRLYENGDGVGQSNTEALSWYRKAAEKGHEKAKEKVKKLEE